LDWAVNVAKDHGAEIFQRTPFGKNEEHIIGSYYCYATDHGMARDWEPFNPTQDWNICAPLMIDAGIQVERAGDGNPGWVANGTPPAGTPNAKLHYHMNGATPQEAICRVIVATHFPDGIEIPLELIPHA
jgi:hypothetical protein